MADDVGPFQGGKARRFDEVDVHADQKRDAPDLRFEDRVAEIARHRPFRLGNIGVRLAVRADDALRADEHGGIVVEVRHRIDLRHADDDEAVSFTRELREALGGRAGDRLDEGRDLGSLVPAIAGRAHLGRHDQSRSRFRRLAGEGQQGLDIALLFEHGRFELDSRSLEGTGMVWLRGDADEGKGTGRRPRSGRWVDQRGVPAIDFRMEAPTVYFGSTMLPRRIRPHWVSSM